MKFIPVGLGPYVQPLDGLYHRVYKDFGKKFFLNHQSRIINNEEEWRELLVECVKEIFIQIGEEVVKKFWKMTGLNTLN